MYLTPDEKMALLIVNKTPVHAKVKGVKVPCVVEAQVWGCVGMRHVKEYRVRLQNGSKAFVSRICK